MSEESKKAREAMKAKAHRLAGGDPHQKVDSSTWTPPEAEGSQKQTGMRPVSKRAFKKGGKVIGKCWGGKSEARADRKPRASGGKAPTTPNSMINRNVKEANAERDGYKHIGGLKTGGRAHKFGGGSMGDNPISQQNRSMSKAAGMAYNKGGKAHRKHREDGGMTMDEMINQNPPTSKDDGFKAPNPVPLPPRRKQDNPPPRDYKHADPRLIAAAKGGKTMHDDEAADKKLIKKMVKPSALEHRAHKMKGGPSGILGRYLPKAVNEIGWRGAETGEKAERFNRDHTHADWKASQIAEKKYAKRANGADLAMKKLGFASEKPFGKPAKVMATKDDEATGRKKGGKVFSGDSLHKIPGAAGGRSAHAAGGKAGKGKTNINIIIAGGHGKEGAGNMPNAPVPAPNAGRGVPMPMPPAAGGMPAGMMPPGGMPPMPPGGMPPMGRNAGGRTMHVIDHASGGGEGRLEKIKAYGIKPKH